MAGRQGAGERWHWAPLDQYAAIMMEHVNPTDLGSHGSLGATARHN